LSNWIRAAKDGRFALPADALPSFVPVVVEPAQANNAAPERRACGPGEGAIEGRSAGNRVHGLADALADVT
jgi:hypothetical protein